MLCFAKISLFRAIKGIRYIIYRLMAITVQNDKCIGNKRKKGLAIKVSPLVFNHLLLYASCTVHPVGMPLTPVVQDSILGFLTNVPVEATPDTQLFVQPDAEISVAKHLM